MSARLEHEPDPRVGDWIAPRLGSFGANVGSLVPRGFEAYARILHPAADDAGEPARWADVAASCGTALHPTAQWWALSGAPAWGEDGRWSGHRPGEGSLPTAELHAVVDVLAAHTAGGRDAPVVAALWEGFGWIHGGGAVAVLWGFGDGRRHLLRRAWHRAAGRVRSAIRLVRPMYGFQPSPPGFEPEVLDAPRLELPARGYLLFRGPLGAVAGERGTPWPTTVERSWSRQSPNLLWAADRSWCLATEIDLDSTVIGGSAALVDALLAHPGLEALPVGEDDSLMTDGDAVNR